MKMQNEITSHDVMVLLGLTDPIKGGLSVGGDGAMAALDAELDSMLLELEAEANCQSEAKEFLGCSRPVTAATFQGREPSSSITAHVDSNPASAASSLHSYRFEVATAGLENEASDSLMWKLRELAKPTDSEGIWATYQSVREQTCAIAIELNHRARSNARFGPRFRPQRTPPFKCHTPEERALSRDRQVIDLHWLWCVGHQKAPDSHEYVRLFEGQKFDFQLASKFACERWTTTRKKDCLRLDAQTEWQLAAIQSRNFQKRWDEIRKGRFHIERVFTDSLASRRASETLVKEWVDLWAVSQMVGESPEQVSQLLQFVSGEPAKDPSGVSKRLKRLKQRIAMRGRRGRD